MDSDYMEYLNIDEDEIYKDDEGKIYMPTICPHCKRSGKQRFIHAFKTVGEFDDYDAILLSFCYACKSTAVHFLNGYLDQNDEWTYTSAKSIPAMGENITISDYISDEFPDFKKIYEQSVIAEESELDLIAGMGYRKAVEFLVSDYLIKFPEKSNGASKDWVKNPKISLNQKIQKISDPRIQTVSKAIAWIGNDETHYTRRHEDKGINSMKTFIKALLALIEFDKTVSEAKQFISED